MYVVNTKMAYWTFFGDDYAKYQISYGCPIDNGHEIGGKILTRKFSN